MDDDYSNDEQQLMQLTGAIVIGVPQLDSYKSCLHCKAHVEPDAPEPGKPLLGRCTKCAMLQRFDACHDQLRVKLMVQQEINGHPLMKSLHCFGKIILDFIGVSKISEVTREALLQSQPANINYNEKQVITAFTRD